MRFSTGMKSVSKHLFLAVLVLATHYLCERDSLKTRLDAEKAKGNIKTEAQLAGVVKDWFSDSIRNVFQTLSEGTQTQQELEDFCNENQDIIKECPDLQELRFEAIKKWAIIFAVIALAVVIIISALCCLCCCGLCCCC